MQKNWRKILFLLLFFLFLVLSPIIVLYSQGIRFDFKKKRFTQTGAIYLKVIPKEVEVYLNGKYFKKTNSLSGTLRIKNLIPGKYLIEVKKEGFFSWKKEAEVKEKLVTEFVEVVLFPREIKFQKTGLNEEEFLALKKKEGFLPCKDIIERLRISRKNFSENCKAFEIGNKIFLIEEKSIFVFSKETENLEKLIENWKGIDKKDNKIAVFTPHEIWILSEKGAEFLIREREEIKDLAFLDKNYLVFLDQDNAKIVETDTEGGLNLYEIGIVKGKKVATDKERKVLILKEGGVLSSQSLY
jgi:hypothetical protein